MGILYFLESIRNPVLDAFFSFITEFGGETFFLGAALFLYWCVDKRQGYYLMAVGFLGTLANQFLKLCCRVPRPWVRDPNFTIVESAREGASGYSFPSGHSQTGVGTYGVIGRENRNGWGRWLCVVLCILVPLSRMYLGVHTLSDVLVGSGMALLFIALLRPVVYGKDGRYIPVMFGVMVLLALLFLAYTELWPFPADIDPHNLESAVKNSYTLLGSLLGMIVAWYADEKWLHFSTKGIWYVQILKIAVGAMLVLGVKAGLKTPLEALFAGHMVSRAVRYFLVVIVAGVVWPMTFRWFAGWGKKER